MTTIFISYSSKDSELARLVFDSLTNNGISCWLAEKSIKPGENYAMAIISALDTAEIVMLLYTGNSNISPEIHKEIERASSKRIPIVPVRFENVPYHPALEYHLGVAQWIDAVGAKRDKVIGQLATSVSNVRGGGDTAKVAPSRSNSSVIQTTSPKFGLKSIGLGLLAVSIVFAAYMLIPSGNKVGAVSSESSAKNESLQIHPAALNVNLATASRDAKKVAILYFDNTGKSAELDVLRKGFADMLISDMNGKGGLSIVEREKLNEVLKEIQLQGSQSFDPASAARIGKLLGAEYIVTGGFFEMMGKFRIDAKAIRVETGEVVASVGATGSKNEFMEMEKHLATDLISNMGQAGTPPAQLNNTRITYAVLKDYSEVLDMIDQGEKDVAVQRLRTILKANPEFEPAKKLFKKIEA